ncbi:hypothetical protein Tco_0738983 [Tanacetum coccineum]
MAQRIRLFYKGKDHGEYILQSINKGSFKMGQYRDEIATGSELTKDDRESQLYDEFEHFRQHKGENIHDYYFRVQGNNARGVVAAENWGAQNRAGNANAGQGKPIKCYNCNWIDEEQLLFLAGRKTNTFDDDVDEGLVQDMAQNEDNIFQADQCNASNSDADEAPTNQTMFMANLSSADLVYDEAGPSYDSDTLSEVQDHDNCLDNMNESPEEHEMHNDVQPIDVVDSDTEYTSNSNIISYKQPKLLKKRPNLQKLITALINEIKEMKEVFDQIEAEVDQNAVDKKCDEIERKNILIENENLTAECLSKDVFYTATDYVLTVSRFSDMHDAYTAAQKRIAELEAKNFNLTQKIQTVDHDEMIKHFSKLEVDHLNLKLKYQHLKERFGNKKLVTSSDAPTFE